MIDGAIKSPADSRDLQFKELMFQNKLDILPKVDLRNLDLSIRNQGSQGSCTAFSSCAGKEILVKSKNNLELQFSPAFMYYFSRMEAFGTVNEDRGCYTRTVMKTWYKYGCCLEKDFPYNPQIYTQKPSDIAIQNAAKNKISGYFYAGSLNEIKAALSHKMPVVMVVNTSLILGMTGKNGAVSNPAYNNTSGYHAVLVVGYYDHPQYAGGGFIVVRNSWGPEWGNQGYFHFPYKLVQDKNWFIEGWVMK